MTPRGAPTTFDAPMGHSVDLEHLPGMTDIAAHETSPWAATVRRAAAGDQDAFARLVTEHHATMRRVAFAIAADDEVAADAVQSAWSIAWRRLGSLRDPDQVRAWLVAVAA